MRFKKSLFKFVHWRNFHRNLKMRLSSGIIIDIKSYIRAFKPCHRLPVTADGQFFT